jgi:Sec-independent protein translocase protein TatA
VFGVGIPEALLIALVGRLVFGPGRPAGAARECRETLEAEPDGS